MGEDNGTHGIQAAPGLGMVAGDVRGEANARLIAAAPDLLVALKIIAPWRMRDGSPCFCPAGRDEDELKGEMPTMHSTACDMGRAAIAKVEGRS